MNWFSTPKPDLATILKGERRVLEHIFGGESYRIEAVDNDEASLKTEKLEIRFARDERDGDVGCNIALNQVIEEFEEGAGSFMWASFLGDEEIAKPRDRNGQVISSAEEQIAEELTLLGRLVKEIYSDAQKTRDAVFWIIGYETAGTHHAMGLWD